MKKLLVAAAVAASTILFTGCGGKPKVPANTVAAGYVDLGKALWNVSDVVELVIGELPKEQRKSAEEEFEKFIKEHKPDFKAVDLDWACITLEVYKDSPACAVVVKCDTKEKIPSLGCSIEDVAAGALKKIDTRNGCDIYAYVETGYGNPFRNYAGGYNGACIAFVDGKYMICTGVKGFVDDDDKAFIGRMIDLYKDGKGDESDDFDDLTDIGGDTIARFQTAEVETVVDILDARAKIEKFAEDVGDEDLIDMFMDVENITLDVNLSDDVLGGELTVAAGSRELAKVVESAFNVAKFATRVYSSIGVAALGDTIDGIIGKIGGPRGKGKLKPLLKDIGGQIRDAVEVDRSGSTATLTVEFDTEDLVETIVEAAFEEK